ncbi:uncharacterized protein LOC108819852 [Raphanus sativus]|uniref:Uncharacterized protein LOC108819852 n=1 Tax=Raphanus sativus TaxID=3726 RepID=A0A6J0KLD1_RAPSA|nr:uncharacterized protein LOC108819852 [Raphanus sativus]
MFFNFALGVYKLRTGPVGGSTSSSPVEDYITLCSVFRIYKAVWHIDDCLLFVLPWTPEDSFKIPEISTLPVWVNLKNIPDCCYSRLGISHVASGLGKPILTHKPRLDPTSMGEAKVLVEMELDRDFPKLITLDDKQGSIFLVGVEYTWIPSMCERCGNLGHKAKRCLLPSMPANDSALLPQTKDVLSDIPVVDIDLILHERDISASPSSTMHPKDSKAIDNLLISTSESSAHVLEEVHHVAASITLSPSHSQQVKPVIPLNSVPAFSTLVDAQSTPIDSQIMENTPSSIINNKVLEPSVIDPLTTTTNHCAFESLSRFTVLEEVEEAEIESSNSFSMTRGGRESKPPIKYQNMEWKTVRGRGNRGRRGRGSYQ